MPDLVCNHFVAVLLRAHLAVPIPGGGKHRTMHWTPDFDRPPPPLWRPGAPIGYGEAAKWHKNRDLAATLAQGQPAAPASSSSSGQVLVPAVVQVRRRLVGKQPGSVSLAAPMPITPAPKARAAARPERLKEDNLNDEEKAMIAGLTAIRRNQMLKAIQHNRTAVGAGRHFIVWSGSNVDEVGQLTCRDC